MTTARAEYVKNKLINVFFVVLKTHGNRTSAHLKLSEHLPLCGMYLIDKGILTRMFYQGTCANRSFQRSCCGLAWFLSLRPANIESTTIQKQHVSLPRNKQRNRQQQQQQQQQQRLFVWRDRPGEGSL